jgi:hypothetical protein
MAMSAPKQVAATWAVLLALAAVVYVAMGHHRPDDDSYRAGYTAVSNPEHARTLMALAGKSSWSVCDALLDRRSVASATRLVQADFVSGCTHAIADAME